MIRRMELIYPANQQPREVAIRAQKWPGGMTNVQKKTYSSRNCVRSRLHREKSLRQSDASQSHDRPPVLAINYVAGHVLFIQPSRGHFDVYQKQVGAVGTQLSCKLGLRSWRHSGASTLTAVWINETGLEQLRLVSFSRRDFS